MVSGSSKFKGNDIEARDKVIVKKGGAICQEMTNGSGADVERGDVIILKTSAGRGMHFDTSSGGDDDQVIGMAFEDITDGSLGLIQTYGFTPYLKVDGNDNISQGDFISTYTAVGIGQKGTIGSGNCIAIAAEAYTTNDSAGVIDAFLLGSAR